MPMQPPAIWSASPLSFSHCRLHSHASCAPTLSAHGPAGDPCVCFGMPPVWKSARKNRAAHAQPLQLPQRLQIDSHWNNIVCLLPRSAFFGGNPPALAYAQFIVGNEVATSPNAVLPVVCAECSVTGKAAAMP